jgi:hypothetical protein
MSDGGPLNDGVSESLEERMQSMEGQYFMRLYVNERDGSARPLIKGFSTVEIKRGASGLEMVEQPCHYWGMSRLWLDLLGTTEFDAAKTPQNVHQLEYDGQAFDSAQAGITALGYDPEQPPGCTPGETKSTTVDEKPWLHGADCTCPSNLTELPEPKKNDDCRINDDDHDGAPGVTLVGKVEGFLPVEMYLVQRSQDQFFDLDYKNAQRKILLANFYTTRTNSLLGCPPPDNNGGNCTSKNPVICPAKHNTAEFVRVAPGQTFSCDGLYEAEAVVGLFSEPAPANCEQ